MLADIFLGKLKKWDDPRISALNPGLKLQGFPISVVHRSDGSRTTFILTNYLSKVSPDWKTKSGEGTAVNWPAGVGGKGNEGVATYVQRIKGSIGYVEYAYALQNKMNSKQASDPGSFCKFRISMERLRSPFSGVIDDLLLLEVVSSFDLSFSCSFTSSKYVCGHIYKPMRIKSD